MPHEHTLSTLPSGQQQRIEVASTELTAQGIVWQRNVPLASLARWRIGGPTDLFVQPRNTVQVAQVVALARQLDLPLFALGAGSNMLFDDRGFRGIVLQIGPGLDGLTNADSQVMAGAGLWVPHFAHMLARRGLCGLEHVVGIPGRLGGLVVMNGGSQRKGIGTHVQAIRAVTSAGEVVRLERAALDYRYRNSALQGSGAIVTEVELTLVESTPSVVRREMIAILAERRRKFPKNLPNCGSTFLSNPAMYDQIGSPGRAIEAAGLKGMAIGGA